MAATAVTLLVIATDPKVGGLSTLAMSTTCRPAPPFATSARFPRMTTLLAPCGNARSPRRTISEGSATS
jgi:hypothetical protein